MKSSILLLLAWLAGATLQAQATGEAQPASPDSGTTPPTTTFYATATVRERDVDEAAGSVTVIGRDTLEASGARTVADALRDVAGVYVSSGGTRGGVVHASIRGGDPNFTFVLLDGVPLNDTTDLQGGAFNLDSLPVSLVERIEIVRGPTSSFYGSSGLAGIIHVQTRRGSGAPAFELESGAGNASLRHSAASVGGATNGGGDYFLGASWDEEKERIADEAFEQWNVQGSFGVPVGSGSLRLTGRATSWQATDYPEASGGPVYGSGELRDSDHQEASLGAELLLGNQRFSAAWSRHDLERASPGVFPQVPPSFEETSYRRSRLGWTSTFLSRPGLELSGGLDVEREQGNNVSLLLLPPFLGGDVAGDYDVDRTQGGAHLQLLGRRGNLGVEVGLRADVVEDGEEVSPRLGLSWRTDGGKTRLHASAGQAFKLPSFFALASPRALGGNPDLKPETSTSVDAGVEHAFASGLRLGLTLFYSRFEDLVDFDFDLFLNVNRSRVDAQGAELTLAYRASKRFSVAAEATFQETEDQATGEALLRRPDFSGSLRLIFRPVERATLWLDVQSVSRLPDAQIPVPELRFADPYELVSLAASWRLREHWELSARLDNVLDEGYETLIGFPGPGRSGLLVLRFRSRLAAGESAP